MITSSELDVMRALQTATLELTCQIRRKTLTDDSMGGQTESWANSGSQTVCRISEISNANATERLLADREVSQMGYIVTLPYGKDVIAGDRLLISGSRTFEILGVIKRSYETATRVICTEIQ